MSEHESFLPKVEETDLLDMVFEDISDPDHAERWQHFSAIQSTLAREVLKRASLQSENANRSPAEQQKLIVYAVTFAFSALERAVRRTQERTVAPIAGDGVVDGEDQPLSA